MVIKEDTIAKISWGMLGSMAAGIVAIVAYASTLSASQENTQKQVEELKVRVLAHDQIATDMAVIKAKVESIEQMIREDHDGR
jgi:hypothetical protein